jgi:hypothetical protein
MSEGKQVKNLFWKVLAIVVGTAISGGMLYLGRGAADIVNYVKEYPKMKQEVAQGAKNDSIQICVNASLCKRIERDSSERVATIKEDRLVDFLILQGLNGIRKELKLEPIVIPKELRNDQAYVLQPTIK